MLADPVKLGCGGICFSLGSGTKALYPSNISIYAFGIRVGGSILTVVLNILAESCVSELLELGGQEEALGDSYGTEAMQPPKVSKVWNATWLANE